MPTKDNNDFDDVTGGFEFEAVPSWDDVQEEKSAPAEKSDFETDFTNLDFGGGTDSDNSENDNGFGFNFDAMPTEQSVTSEQHRGDPSAEFEEFGITQDDYSSNSGFGSHDDVPTSADEASQFDEFDQAFAVGGDDHNAQAHGNGDNSYYDDATDVLTNGQYLGAVEDDPYAQVHNEQPGLQSNQTQSAPIAQKSLLSKLILPVGIGAIVLVGGFVGYSTLMSSTAPAPVVVADTPVVNEPQFPSVLPPEATGETPVTPTPPVATDVAVNPPLAQPSENQELTFDLPSETAASTTSPVDVPVVGTAPVSTLPGDVVPTTETALPIPVETATPVQEAAPVSNLPAPEDIALKSDLKDVLDRLASLEDKVDDLADSFSAKVSTPVLQDQVPVSAVSAGSGLNANALPVASIDNIDPPLKPIVIKDLSLVGVSGDTAWIKTGGDVISVKKSDTLPNGGKVEDIRRYRGDWVLVATDGIVLR
jgi:hypothetical protein